MWEKNEIKKKNKNEGPKKIPKKKICVNLTNCKYKIVQEVLEKKLNFKIFKNDEENLNCDIIWYDAATNNDLLTKLKPFQKTNHFPGIIAIARKNFLAYHLNKMKKKYPLSYNFFPDTFSLPSDNSQIYKIFKNNKKNYFIIKPENKSQGKGIFLINKFEQIPLGENLIMQKYIENPLLIEGNKFDLRIYALITSISPLTIFLYKEGIARFSTDTYSKPNNGNMKNKFQHLTNYSLNKNSEKFFFSKNANKADIGHKRSLKSIWDYLEKNGVSSEKIINDIKKIVIKTICSIQPILAHVYNTCQSDDFTGAMCFQILGFDVIIDENYNTMLLEVNHAPSFNSDTPFDVKNKSELIFGAMKILGVNLDFRNSVINEIKRKFRKRIESGKRVVLSLEEKKIFKMEFRNKFFKGINLEEIKYECIFSDDINFDEPYEEFMEYASCCNKKKTGISNKQKKFKEKSVIQQMKKKKNSLFVKKNNYSKKKKHEIILNSVNRLYKKNYIQNKENRIYNKKTFYTHNKLLTPKNFIKTKIINLQFDDFN